MTAAPTSVTVMDPDASGVLVEWAAVAQVNGLDVKHYELERLPTPFDMTTTVTDTKYQDKGATGSANPVYRVRAVNEAGVAGPWSQTSRMTPRRSQELQPPTVAMPQTRRSDLSWGAPDAVTGVTVSGYDVEYWTAPTGHR